MMVGGAGAFLRDRGLRDAISPEQCPCSQLDDSGSFVGKQEVIRFLPVSPREQSARTSTRRRSTGLLYKVRNARRVSAGGRYEDRCRNSFHARSGWMFCWFSAPRFWLMALYTHPEFVYPIVNLTCVRAPVAEDQAASRRRFQVAYGQGHCRNALLGSPPGNRHIVSARR